MAALVVDGGRPLSGAVTVEGNKNAALPILAACLLAREPCVLENVPRIRDVSAMCQLLEGLGARVEGVGTSTLSVSCPEIRSTDPDPALVARIRGSVLLTAPLLARSGRAGLGESGRLSRTVCDVFPSRTSECPCKPDGKVNPPLTAR
jgi:UDP-N-acetylglucosamine 1-carboxyvinyltransferase